MCSTGTITSWPSLSKSSKSGRHRKRSIKIRNSTILLSKDSKFSSHSLNRSCNKSKHSASTRRPKMCSPKSQKLKVVGMFRSSRHLSLDKTNLCRKNKRGTCRSRRATTGGKQTWWSKETINRTSSTWITITCKRLKNIKQNSLVVWRH